MVHLGSKPFRGKREQEAYDRTYAGRYQKLLRKNHFLYFGLPFILSIVAGSLYLQKFTAVKWEKYDERYRQVGEEEMLSMIENKRPVDKKNDYYRLQGLLHDHENEVSSNEDYEIVRVKRKKEDEPVWWEVRGWGRSGCVAGDAGWSWFRDVLKVDRKPVWWVWDHRKRYCWVFR